MQLRLIGLTIFGQLNIYNGIIIRAKVDFVEYNEKKFKYFSSLEKKNAENKTLYNRHENNTILTDQKEILNASKCFYSKLSSKEHVDTEKCDFYDNSMIKLNESEKIHAKEL